MTAAAVPLTTKAPAATATTATLATSSSACTFLLDDDNDTAKNSLSEPNPAFGGIFMAKLLKDTAMANKVN